MSHEWDCEVNGCKLKDGYCQMCGVSADGTHDKPVRSHRPQREPAPEILCEHQAREGEECDTCHPPSAPLAESAPARMIGLGDKLAEPLNPYPRPLESAPAGEGREKFCQNCGFTNPEHTVGDLCIGLSGNLLGTSWLPYPPAPISPIDVAKDEDYDFPCMYCQRPKCNHFGGKICYRRFPASSGDCGELAGTEFTIAPRHKPVPLDVLAEDAPTKKEPKMPIPPSGEEIDRAFIKLGLTPPHSDTSEVRKDSAVEYMRAVRLSGEPMLPGLDKEWAAASLNDVSKLIKRAWLDASSESQSYLDEAQGRVKSLISLWREADIPAPVDAELAAPSLSTEGAGRQAKELLARAADLLDEVSTEDDPTFWGDYYTYTGHHMILTEEGWQPGEEKQGLVDELGPDAILDEVNPAAPLPDSKEGR